MADQKDKTKQATDDPAQTAMNALRDAGFGNMAGMTMAWAETMSGMGAEVVSFMAERIKEDVETQQKILHCKDPAELQHIQAHFIQKAMDQYQEETGKLVEMGTNAFRPKTD